MSQSNDAAAGCFNFIGRTVVLIPAVVVRFLLGAVVIYKYWQWFVVPVVQPSINPGVLQFIGLSLLLTVLPSKWVVPRKKTPEEQAIEKAYSYTAIEKVFLQMAAMFVALGVGWMLKTYVIGPDPAWLDALVN